MVVQFRLSEKKEDEGIDKLFKDSGFEWREANNVLV